MPNTNMYLVSDPKETITVVDGDITYIAEAPPETPVTLENWVTTRIEVVSATVTTIQVKRALCAPGTNGANLATIWGD